MNKSFSGNCSRSCIVSTPSSTRLHRVTKLIVILTAMLHLGSLPLAQGVEPRLAIINKHSNPRFCDLLFLALSASSQVDLVERDRIALVQEELEAAVLGAEDNVKIGRTLDADVLLFVEQRESILHVRLVESRKGEQVLTAVREDKIADYPQIVRDVQAVLDSRYGKLTTKRENRCYVAILPTVADQGLLPYKDSLRLFRTLLGTYLSRQDSIILVEREYLPDVTNEQEMRGQSYKDLSTANFILRSRATRKDKLTVESLLQRTGVQEKQSFRHEFDECTVDKAAQRLASQIVTALDLENAPTADLAFEAKNYYVQGHADRLAGRSLQSAKAFEIAWLLNREDTAYAKAFVYAVSTYTVTKSGGPSYAGNAVPEEYMRRVHWIRKAMNVERIANSERRRMWLMSGSKHGSWQWRFLTRSVDKFSHEERQIIRACRAEMKAYFECFCGKDKRDLLMKYCPLFFAEPAAAMTCIREITKDLPVTWHNTHDNVYPTIRYWDQQQARNLWREYLDELCLSESRAEQFAGLSGRCFLDGVFDGDRPLSSPIPEERRQSAERLFEWLRGKRHGSPIFLSGFEGLP